MSLLNYLLLLLFLFGGPFFGGCGAPPYYKVVNFRKYLDIAAIIHDNYVIVIAATVILINRIIIIYLRDWILLCPTILSCMICGLFSSMVLVLRQCLS